MVRYSSFVTPDTRIRRIQDQTRRELQRRQELDQLEQRRAQEIQSQMEQEQMRGAQLDQTRDTEYEAERARGLALDENMARFREVEQRPSTIIGEPTATPTPAPSLSPVAAERRRRADLLAGIAPTPPEPTGQPSGPTIALQGLERVRRQFTAPIAGTALQIAESPIGSQIPGVAQLKQLGRQVESVGVPEAISPLPRTRTLEETGRFVNPFAAIAGDKEEQERALTVLEEAGLPRSLATELILDPLNLLPVVGFTKIDDFARLVRVATRAAPEARAAAVQTLRQSGLIQDALRGVREAGEAGGRPLPLRGGGTLNDARKAWWNNLSTAERKAIVEAQPEGRFIPKLHDKSYQALLKSGRVRVADDAFQRAGQPGFDLRAAREPVPPTPEEVAFGRRETRLAGDETAFDNYIAKGDPGPPPPREPPTGRLTPDDPEFDDILDAAIKGDQPDQALMRRHQGVIDARASQFAVEVTDNNKELVRIGLGQHFRGSVVAKTEGSFDELNSLLHNPGAVARGERVVPDELRPMYDKLRAQTDWEQAARVDFDPNQALVEDYFFRGWKPPEGLFTGAPQRGSLGRNPAFRLPRVDATYDEMFEAGFRPMFENPAEQARHSQLMGIKYREQMKLIEKMRASELALPVKGGPIPEGWRVPEVGPAFQGKPYSDGVGVSYTRQWAVEDSMANRLENIYGKMPRLGKGEAFGKKVDFQKVVDFLTFVPKKAKLVGSVFQHLDFLQRSGSGAWSGFADALRRGQPVAAVGHLAKWPKSAVEIAHSTFSPGARARLAKLGVDPKPLWKDRQISNLMLREEGLSLRDPTLGIDLDDVIRQVKQEPRIVKLGKAPIRALDALERQWRQGLFQGTYPAAILSDVKNNIGPMIMRQHPEATDRQLAGMIAKAANKLYSVVPESQSVIQNKQARWFLTRFLFSLGENEGLLRSFTGAIKGENAALFRTRLAGTYLGLMALASTIHFASTGKPLPLDRFVPVSKDKFGPLPFGYNTDFASPTLPIKGRGGVDIELDLVMQQDTIFRILDPKSFLNARFSVPVSTIRNQAAGTDFFGAPIDTVGPGGIFSRTSQLVQDMFAPIGAGQAGLEIFRNNVEESEGLITPGEGRLGTAGLGIQAGGVNLRAERTPDLLDRIRGEVMRDRGIEESYAEITATDLPLKNDIDTEVEERVGAELEIRGETAKLRGQQTLQSEGFEAIETTREAQQTEQLDDDAKLNSGQWAGDAWRDKYRDRQRGFFNRREQIKADFQIEFDEKEAPPASVNAAIDAYFDVDVDRFPDPRNPGETDWDGFFGAQDAALAPLSGKDRKRVMEFIHKFDTPTVTEFRKAQDIMDRFFETPKYVGLSLKQGEEVDRVLFELAPALQTRFEAQTGEELTRRDAVRHLAAIIRDKKAREFLLEHFGGGVQAGLRRIGAGGGLRRITDVRRETDEIRNEKRDQILIDNERMLARFYPDVLERELSREQEAGLLPSTLEALFGPAMTLPDIERRGLRRIGAGR